MRVAALTAIAFDHLSNQGASRSSLLSSFFGATRMNVMIPRRRTITVDIVYLHLNVISRLVARK
jgi:hypothetical protein